MNKREKFGFLLTTAFIILLFFLFSRTVKIKSIDCVSQYGPCSKEILDKVSLGKGKSVYYSKKKISEALLREIQVDKFSFQFKFPDTLNVYVIERKPKFALKELGTDKVSTVGSDGRILSYPDASNLPTLIINSPNPLEGGLVDPKTLFALEILASLYSTYRVDTAHKEEFFLVVELNKGPRVIFPLEGDKDVLLGSFVLIYNELNKGNFDSRIEEGKVATVDLRFKNPVLIPKIP